MTSLTGIHFCLSILYGPIPPVKPSRPSLDGHVPDLIGPFSRFFARLLKSLFRDFQTIVRIHAIRLTGKRSFQKPAPVSDIFMPFHEINQHQTVQPFMRPPQGIGIEYAPGSRPDVRQNQARKPDRLENTDTGRRSSGNPVSLPVRF